MRGSIRPVTLLVGLAVALCGLLSACGLTQSSGTAAGASSSPGTTVINGTPGTVHTVPSTTASPSTPSGTPDTSGKVTLVLDKTAYAPGSAAMVAIENGLGAQIAVTNHHTNCSYVQLEQLVAGVWQPVELCKLMTPIRLVDLAAGSVTAQKIGIPDGGEAAGSYRVMLRYNDTTAYSATFTVD